MVENICTKISFSPLLCLCRQWVGRYRMHCVFMLSVRPSVRLFVCPCFRNICDVPWLIFTKLLPVVFLETEINWWGLWISQRSKVKVRATGSMQTATLVQFLEDWSVSKMVMCVYRHYPSLLSAAVSLRTAPIESGICQLYIQHEASHRRYLPGADRYKYIHDGGAAVGRRSVVCIRRV